MKLEQIQEGKTVYQVARAERRYVYLAKSNDMKKFDPIVNKYRHEIRGMNEKIIFRVSVRDNSWLDKYTDDWVPSEVYDRDLPEQKQYEAQKYAEQFARDFAEQYGIPYVHFEVKWHTSTIKYTFY